MKRLFASILTLLALSMGGSAAAQTACVPYSIPITSTVTACGAGLIGSKYKTSTKVCPSGTITTSADYDTSGCAPAPSGSSGVIPDSLKCVLTPGACAALPVAQNCPTGYHWTLAGSNVAHCVADDPVCPWGTSLTHDTLGNPSCIQNTCSGGQVLQANGISCACPANTVMSGGTCIALPPTCVAGTSTDSSSCASPQTGTMYRTVTTSCPSGSYGSPSTSYGTWNTSSCVTPATTCTPSSSTQSQSCPSGQTGTMSQTVTTSCPSGAFGSPSTSYSAWDTSGCSSPQPICTPTTSTTYQACGTGYTGNIVTTTNYLCPSGTSQTQDTSGCGCANGAPDYPTCTTNQQQAQLICPRAGTSVYGCTVTGIGKTGKYMETRFKDDGTGTGTCTSTKTQVGLCGYNPGFWFNMN